MSQLVQPILVTSPEPGHDPEKALSLKQFTNLLREEEDYYPSEQNNTKLMITRLRKIFYDQWGWNSELIRGAAHIEGRYEVKIMSDSSEHSKEVKRYKKNDYEPKHRVITYRPNDRVYGDTRVGQTPLIYQNDHQEVRLPDGTYCDIAHILAGLDAYNYKQVVSPLPKFLEFFTFLVPHVESNMDIVTWLGDIASTAGDFLFYYLRHGKTSLNIEREQAYINSDASGSDMLGDIDPYVIAHHYDVSSNNGQRFTDILTDYYLGESSGKTFRENRFSTYCSLVGLKGWDGEKFDNEKRWMKFYKKQLRDNISFQVFSLTQEKLKSIWLPLLVWFNGYGKVLKKEELLDIYLIALKELIKKEPKNH